MKSASHLLFVFACSIVVLTSCSPDDNDETPDPSEAQYVSMFQDHSGWSSIAFDHEIFYPPGGFSGYQHIKLSQPFVANGKPWAVAAYSVRGSTGSSKNLVTVENGEVVRYPLSGNGEIITGNEDLYRFLVNDEDEFFLRRLNAPDYSTYNSFEWDSKDIEKVINRTGAIVGNYSNTGIPDIIESNGTTTAYLSHFVNVRPEGETQARMFMAISNTSFNGGQSVEVELLPFNQTVQESGWITSETKVLNDKVLTVINGGDDGHTALFAFGSFEDGFEYIKELPKFRTITSFFKGKDHFFCVLEESGGSQKFGFKIDLAGKVTELGNVTGATDYGYTHYKGDLVVAVNKDYATTNPVTSVKRFTASGSETLGASPLTKDEQLHMIMSDGDELYSAIVNDISPRYFSGGRQFEVWEFLKYEP